jgi:YVTN family beta-propeller protein
MSAPRITRVKASHLGAWLAALGLLLTACSQSTPAEALAHVLAVIPVHATPSAGLDADSSAIWIPSDLDGSISRVDPLTNQVSATIQLAMSRSCTLCWGAVATHGGSVWATSSSARLALLSIDPVSNQVSTSVPLPIFPSAVTSSTDGMLWVASVLDSAVVRFDPATQQVQARIGVPRPSRLAAGQGTVWVISIPDDAPDGRVVGIDARTDQVVANVEVGVQPTAIAYGEDSVWVVDEGTQRVQRIDARTNAVVASIPVGFLPTGVAVSDGSVWVVSLSAPGVDGPALSRIDPATNTNLGSVSLGHGAPMGLTVGAGSLWVATRNPDTVVRVQPSGGAAESQPLVLGVVLMAVVVALWTWWQSAHGPRWIRAVSGRQILQLRRFSELRARVDPRAPRR